MASKANKDFLKHLKSKPKPELGTISHDDYLIGNLSVNNPISQDSPTIIILCGPSGSGKSTIKSSLLSENNITNYINVDPDDIRSLLTEHGMNFEGEDPKVMAGITNQFNSRMMLYATANRFNIVFDTTGRNMHAMKEALTLTDGYFKVFAAVYTTWENCQARIIARNAQNIGKRKELPLEIAREIKDGFYLYLKSIQVKKNANINLYKVIDSNQSIYSDEFFGTTEILRKDFKISINNSDSLDLSTILINYQGCSDSGFCYPMQTKKLL